MSRSKTVAMLVLLGATLQMSGCAATAYTEHSSTVPEPPPVTHYRVDPPQSVVLKGQNPEQAYYNVLTSEDSIELRFQLTHEQQKAYEADGNVLFEQISEDSARRIDGDAVDAVLAVASHHYPNELTVTYTGHPGKPGVNIPVS